MKNHNPRPGLFIWKHWVCLILVLILMQVSCNYFDPLNPYGHIIYWAKSYGASNDEQINTITPLSDGNVIAGGYTYSFGTGGQDAWLIRLDQEGKVTWEKAYGTEMNEEICSICPTSDHNFIVAGYMDNTDDDYMNDIWVMKCDNEGNKLWEERFGRDQVEKAMWIEETQEGDYIIAGKSNTFVGTGFEKYNALLIKFTAGGKISWSQVYGGSEDDEAFIVRVTDDGNMVFGGNTLSFGAGDSDFWLVKVDREGEIIWEKAYGKSGEDRFCSLTQTRDGGFILTGLLDHCETLAIETKWVYQVMKIDENGEILWHKAILYKSFSEPWTVYTSSVDETEGGNYVVAITSEIDTTRGLDFHILKFDQKGNILWQRTYGGSADDSVKCIREVPDYGYIAAGKTYSFDVENTDSWIVKLFPNGECDPLDDTPSVSTVSIACETDDTSAIREKLPSTPWNPSVPSTVTDTDCTVRQQAP